MEDRIEIFTLGGVRILRGGESIAGLNKRKAEALLIYLASTGRSQPREVLADLLWDERTQSQALGNLRVVLSMLHKTLGDSLIIRREAVALNPAAEVSMDTIQLENGLREVHQQGGVTAETVRQVEQALELYRGDFLEGFSVFDCRRFEDWQTNERERLHTLAVDGYAELVAYDIEHREYQQGLVHAARLLELDPLMEAAHRDMMLLLAYCGLIPAALRQYQVLEEALHRELDVEPSPESRQLRDKILSGELASTPLPKGTVTFLFTDIEGSTQLLEKLRDQYAQLLAEHHKLLREVFQRWQGHEVDTQGDAFFVAFGRATDAIACTIEAQQSLSSHSWPKGVKVQVRMGLHTGEPVVARTGYVGMDVHRASRIANVGYGGQVLLSQTTRDLVCSSLPTGTRLRDLGAHMLKDMRYPQEIFQLEIPGLASDFPPLKSLDKLEKEEEPPTPGKSPYMGLQYFDEEDAEWFFGRQAVTDRLVQAVSSHRFLAVIGASGSGKSSVVRAGLVPAMKIRTQPNWLVKVITPSSHPLEALAICLTRESESVTATATLIDDMQGNPRSMHLFCQKNLTRTKDTRPLLVIDQFEELFTLCRSEEERVAFVNNLLYAVGIPDGVLASVITLRADFYEHLAQYVGLRELVSAHQIYIGAMNASELRAAIEEPAKRGGWEFSPGLVDLILSDLGVGENRQPEPGALPLLSHALLETWKRRRGNLLNLKAYTEAGGVRGAIAKTAESVFYRELTPEQQIIAKSIFLRLTELGEGTQDTRRRILIRELIPPGPAIEAEQIQTVLVKLADARLIITGEETVDVAHEALIREWPTLREWLASDREGLRLHRHLTEAAQEWELLEREPGALYRGTRLNQALEWAMANPRELNAGEQAFLEASREAAEREQSEREAQRQRELEAARKLAETEKERAESERQRAEEQGSSAHRLRQRAWLLGGVLVLALILAAAAVVFGRQATTSSQLANQNLATAQSAEQRALSQQATAESERLRAEGEAKQRATAEAIAEQKEREATSRYLTSAALNNLKLDPQLSAHLALQALQIYPEDTFEAENALRQVIPDLRLLNSIPAEFVPIPIVKGSRSGQRMLVRDGDLLIQVTSEGIVLVNMDTLESSLLVPGNCPSFQASWDARFLVAECSIGEQDGQPVYEEQVWEIDAQEQIFNFPESIASGFIPSSSTHPLLVFGVYDDLTIHVWEVLSGEELYVFSGHSKTPELMDLVQGIATQDGTRLATYGFDGQVILWDVDTGKKLSQFSAHSMGVGSAAFKPDGTQLATWGFDNTINVWDLSFTEPKLDLTIDHENAQSFLMYSPDGTRLAAGGGDGLVRVWDAQTGDLQLALAGHSGVSWLNSFSLDGKRLYTSATDRSLKEWDLTPGRELLTLPGSIGSESFRSPDGEQLALIVGDSISIVDSQTGEELRSWKAHSDRLTDVSWSPDGSRLATSSGDTMMTASTDYKTKIWEAGTGKLLRELPTDQVKGFLQFAWSPESNYLATTGANATLVWEAATGDLLHTLQQPVIDNPTMDIVSEVDFSPYGQRIATGSYNGSLVIWDTVTGSEIFSQNLGHSIFGLAFSPDGQQLAASQTDGSIILFKLTDDGVEEEPGFADGDLAVLGLDFSPNGALLASGDTAGIVRIWDLKTRQLILKLQTFPDPVTHVAFSPDNSTLAASDQNGITYFYLLPLDELIDLAKSRILLPMTPEQCLEYLHQETCLATP